MSRLGLPYWATARPGQWIRVLAVAAIWFGAAGLCGAQVRQQFPSPLGGTQTAPAPQTYSQPPGGNLQPIPQAPGQVSPYGQTYAQPPGASTPYPTTPGVPGSVAPGTPTYTPAPNGYGGSNVAPIGPQTAPVGPIPGGYPGGTVQPPPSYWDPYAPPGATPPALLPQDPHLPYNTPQFSIQTAQKFLQEARLDYVWLVGHGEKEFGANDVEVYGTFAIPFFRNTQTPLLVTPGLQLHFWEGPITTAPDYADMPANAYDAYLQGAWNPQVTSTFGGELAFRVGVHSDFEHIDDNAIRYQAKGLGVLSLSPNMKVKAGVWYLDRVRVKLLPAGGLIWTPQGPSGNVKLDILFPNPKLAFRLANYRSTEWWLYGRGEYGGGSWSVKRTAGPRAGEEDMVDYNDLRVAAGLEFIRPSGFSGLFETGLSFDRELRYKSKQPEVYYIRPTVFLRGSVAY